MSLRLLSSDPDLVRSAAFLLLPGKIKCTMSFSLHQELLFRSKKHINIFLHKECVKEIFTIRKKEDEKSTLFHLIQ